MDQSHGPPPVVSDSVCPYLGVQCPTLCSRWITSRVTTNTHHITVACESYGNGWPRSPCIWTYQISGPGCRSAKICFRRVHSRSQQLEHQVVQGRAPPAVQLTRHYCQQLPLLGAPCRRRHRLRPLHPRTANTAIVLHRTTDKAQGGWGWHRAPRVPRMARWPAQGQCGVSLFWQLWPVRHGADQADGGGAGDEWATVLVGCPAPDRR